MVFTFSSVIDTVSIVIPTLPSLSSTLIPSSEFASLLCGSVISTSFTTLFTRLGSLGSPLSSLITLPFSSFKYRVFKVNVTVSSIGVSDCPMDSSSAGVVVSMLFSSTTVLFITPFLYSYVVFSGKVNVSCDLLSNSTLSKPVMTLSP